MHTSMRKFCCILAYVRLSFDVSCICILKVEQKKNLPKFFYNNAVKFYSNSKILDIFELLIVLAVEKCPRSLNLSKIWPRYGQNEISYETVKIWKIHWKSKYSESQYYFANISATKARIFMKFYVVVNFYLVSLSFKFHEDSSVNARARVVNVRIRDITCAHAFTTRARAFMHESKWNLKL